MKFLMNNINLKYYYNDIILEILDARNPIRCFKIYKYLSHKTSKHIIILNKSDLVPKWIIKYWLKYFSRFCLCIALSCKSNTNWGKKFIWKLLNVEKTHNKYNKITRILIIGMSKVGKTAFIKRFNPDLKINSLVKGNYLKIFPRTYITEVIEKPNHQKNKNKRYLMLFFKEILYFYYFTLKNKKQKHETRSFESNQGFKNILNNSLVILNKKMIEGKIPFFAIPRKLTFH
mmetsp:Transcript_20461/g.50216  ORF Transcript_20461/g.50216 Transcript_20461/m.50216 type:complete len:231 (+) Transcript_20461:130-822(+)